jgi:hypothetical protein
MQTAHLDVVQRQNRRDNPGERCKHQAPNVHHDCGINGTGTDVFTTVRYQNAIGIKAIVLQNCQQSLAELAISAT